MNKEEIDKWLDNEYGVSYTRLEELHDFYFEKYCDLKQENKQLKDKLSKIETLIINHNCDTGDIYYKYNSRFLKSELKQRILEIVYEEGIDSNEKRRLF